MITAIKSVFLGLALAAIPTFSSLSSHSSSARNFAEATAPGNKDTIAVLFAWDYDAIARECNSTLGPLGYGFVQVSPVQEHIQGSEWWTMYQPVSYKIASRFGDRDSFSKMVQSCKRSGVEVIVDAVINHMSTGRGNVGTGGSSYSKYNYPGNYQDWDFHGCRQKIQGDDYKKDKWRVQECELETLADLKTETDYVRGRLAGFMNDLLDLGVAGFRVDASKHMPSGDLVAIKAKLKNPNIYWIQETIYGKDEVVQPQEYLATGEVQEFRYATSMKAVFQKNDNQKLAYLRNFGEGWAFLSSEQVNVFVTNHDTERNGWTLNYRDNGRYTIAHVFMLAWPYGTPSVHSGYEFPDSDHAQGPPFEGAVRKCYEDGWKCQHYWRQIGNMVKLRNAARGQPVTNWWDNGNHAIAFGRGNKAFVVINNEDFPINRQFSTGLPAGTYCDVQHGDITPDGKCTGPTITVNSNGQFSANVGPQDAVAIYLAVGGGGDPTTKPTVEEGASFTVKAETQLGQNIYVVGNIPELGSWNPANALLMCSATYPDWTREVALKAGTQFEYKYIRKEADGKTVTWESGSNRVAAVPTDGGRVNLKDTWRA